MNISRNNRDKLFAAVIIEISYAVFTRTWLRAYATGTELELLTSLTRFLTILAYWRLFRDLILSRRPRRDLLRQPLFLMASMIVLLVPLLSANWSNPEISFVYRLVFAVMSIVVAIREEFFYRGIIQNLLAGKAGFFVALIVSNLAFTVYHYGAQPFTIHTVIGLFTMGCVMGLVYFHSGSMFAAVTLHALYDAIWALSPFLSNPLPVEWSTLFHVVGLAMFWLWASSDEAFTRGMKTIFWTALLAGTGLIVSDNATSTSLWLRPSCRFVCWGSRAPLHKPEESRLPLDQPPHARRQS